LKKNVKFACKVEYDGCGYAGWQSQKNIATIQDELEKSISYVANHQVKITTAGRTDAGVHATSAVFHFETPKHRDKKSWIFGINSNLPADIKIKKIFQVSNDFDARFSAITRSYRYILLQSLSSSPILNKKVYWIRTKLDLEKMQKGANYLIGEHNFNAYRTSQCQAKHAIRNIHKITITKNKNLVYVDITANAFLHNMIRIIVGCLLQIGTGNKKPIWIDEILKLQQRNHIGETTPPYGLYFVGVEYPKKYKIDNKITLPFL